MIDAETETRVVVLLADARIAEGGAEFALERCDIIRHKQLLKKARDLREQADGLDGEHRAGAWKTEQ